MGVITIRKAERGGARCVIGIAGVSGSGKTYSAIQMAYGMANFRAEKVGFLDTENRRGSLYSDILERATKPTKERFLIGDLVAPFSPARYVEAILEFQKAGVDVLVIDSATHEWEGYGGCDDIANEGNPKVPRWNAAKREHKRFMNCLLQCDMHILACIRAREKVKVERVRGDNGKMETQFTPQGLQPICEKNFMFEMTASVLMHDSGRSHEAIKVPADLMALFPGTGYLTAETGKAIRDWLEAGGIVDPQVEKFRNRLLSVTENGAAYIKSAWLKTPEAVRQALGTQFYDNLVASAKAHDDQKTAAETPDDIADINERINQTAGVPLHFGPHGDPS